MGRIRIIILVVIGLIVGIVSGFYLGIDYDRRKSRYTTIDECVALSRNIRINENTKKCFDNLSSEEFLALLDSQNRDAYALFEEVATYYDRRTGAQKKADGEAVNNFFD